MKIRIKNYQFRLYFSKEQKRTGVCSQVENKPDQHILLWDFDEGNLAAIVSGLLTAQRKYSLSDVFVIESSQGKYHAYCFTAVMFQQAIHILSASEKIDLVYLRLGIVRGFFTLRISPRKGEGFKPVAQLKSKIKPNISPLDVTVNEYLTSNRGER